MVAQVLALALGLIDQNGTSHLAQAQCNIKYFMAFEDEDCSLLSKFDDHEAINQADNKCTPLGDGRYFYSACNEASISIHVYSDSNCQSLVSEEFVKLDECAKFEDPVSEKTYYAMIRNEVISPVAPPPQETQEE